jgi:cation diffusion facilitator CzcD-associated flavoprotein CzcO
MYKSRSSTTDSPVAIIGAGPHGLAAAAHLRHAGIEPHVFGDPMAFWRDQMPLGMLLRSSARASNISDPERRLTYSNWAAGHGVEIGGPVALADFLEYGRWFQREAVPEIDPRMVRRVSKAGDEFELALEDGDTMRATHVAVAAGIAQFPRIPEVLGDLPDELVSHASDHNDLAKFEGRRVAVLGVGQSALESAALLREAGAEPIVISRAASIWWLRGPSSHRFHWPTAPTDIGGRVTSWLAASPDIFTKLPRSKQPEIAFRCIRPAGAHWLRDRVDEVPIRFNTTVAEARSDDGGAVLALSDGSEERVAHVLLGTGYEIDVRRYPFLSQALADSVELVDGYPVLGPGLESSVAGLYFLGAPAAHSCGPVMRFVTGTWYGAPSFASRVRGKRQRPVRFSF